LLHDEQCINGNLTSQPKLHLQQTLLLLCHEPYKYPKATKLNFNTTKEEGDGNKLPSPSSLEQHHKRRRQRIAMPSFFFFRHREEHDNNLLASPFLFQQHHIKI
jgi:hypothetical protein